LALRRRSRADYGVNIAGGLAAAQITSKHAGANGTHLPTKRRAYAILVLVNLDKQYTAEQPAESVGSAPKLRT
jgi:hypothetical protein